MKRFLKYSITLVILSGLIGGGIWYYNQPRELQYNTVVAKKQNIVQTVEATGSVASPENLNLSFKTQGRIRTIDVKTGDIVTRNRKLATIIDETLLSTLDKAQASLDAAEAELDKLLAGATAEEITVSQQKITRARTDLDAVKIDLENKRSTEKQTRDAYIATGIQELIDAAFVVNFTLDVVYDGILDNTADLSYITTNTSQLDQAYAMYEKVVHDFIIVQQETEVARLSNTVTDTLFALQTMRSVLDNTVKFIGVSFTSLTGAIPNATYPQATIAALKTSFNTSATAIASDKTSIQTSIDNLTTGLQALKTSVDETTNSEKKAQEALKLAEVELKLLIAEPQSYEIQQQRAKVLQAQADLRSAQSALTDTVITAPVDGVITSVDFKVGEVAASNQIIVSMITDERLQINVDIPESDINKILIDAKTDISLDAFGVERKFSGIVSFIEPSERVIQDVVYYRVTVLFDNVETEIKPGMTADITVITAERKNVLAVPIRAVIINTDGTKSVRVLDNDLPVSRSISTGIRGDNGNVEVLSGLTEGEVIITGEITR